jgi:novobiocin biosynthesis protein NovU/D-mycarose 3-C-methyltransferase
MDSAVTRIDSCRVCGNEDLTDVISFGLAPLADGFLDPDPTYASEQRYPLDLVRCPDCGLVCLRHVVRPDLLFEDYAYVSSGSETMSQHMHMLVKHCIERYDLAAGDLVVEVGSNIGLHLANFAWRGMRVLGVDPARNLAEVANLNGIETLPLYFGRDLGGRIRVESGPARLVLGRHVVAHINDLTDLLQGVRHLLDDRGVFVMECPYLFDLLQANQFDTIYHEHLSYFCVRTLARLAELNRMRVIEVRRVPVHGGSVVVTMAPMESGWAVDPSVAAALRLEDESRLADASTYEEFADRVRNVIPAVTTLVRDLVADGRRVAGYGAPAKGTMMLSACGFGPQDVEYCTDTTVIKQGKVVAGSHIPVRAPAHAARVPPDYYLMLAWNYSEEILRKEQAFLDRGGRFIIPIPYPRVVSAPAAKLLSEPAAAAGGPTRD